MNHSLHLHTAPTRRSNSVPGPSVIQFLLQFPEVRRDPLGVLHKWKARYGDVFRVPLLKPTYFVLDPADIKHLLLTNQQNYTKTGALGRAKALFGEGLLTSEDPIHKTQRRLMQPMFHHQKIAAFAEIMTGTAQKHLSAWTPGTPFDAQHEMIRITTANLSKAMFTENLSDEAEQVNQAFVICQRCIAERLDTSSPLATFLPTPRNVRCRRALRQLNALVLKIIQSRRSSPGAGSDLLGMLLETRFDDGSGMSDQQIRDEVITMLLAGTETLANSLTWTCYLLARHPDVQDRMATEAKRTLDGRTPTAADVRRLEYIEMVLWESMRLFPPVWALSRRARQADVLPSGVKVPAGVRVNTSAYVVHRDARFFPDPERFDPERFTAEKKEAQPPFAYFPFGGGARSCIGEPFARMEAILVLASIAQKLKLALVPNQNIQPEPLLTLRAKSGVWVNVERR